MEEQMRTELEAAAFRRLVKHLRERSDLQNIDLMELAGFCRNCLANWYQEAAAAKGVSLSKEEAREISAVCLMRIGGRRSKRVQKSRLSTRAD
jgi:uncharacterized protein